MPMSFQYSSKFLLNELTDVAATTDEGSASDSRSSPWSNLGQQHQSSQAHLCHWILLDEANVVD